MVSDNFQRGLQGAAMSDYISILVTPNELKRLIHSVDQSLYEAQYILKELLSHEVAAEELILIYQSQITELTKLSDQLKTAV